MRLMSVPSLHTAVSDSAMSESEEAGMYEVVTGAPSPGMDRDEQGHVAHQSACDSAQLPKDEDSDADDEDDAMYGAGARRTARGDADLYVKGKSKTRKGSTYRFRFRF